MHRHSGEFVTLRTGLGSVRRNVLNLSHQRTIDLGNSGPFVSFSFDDFPLSAYHTGGSVLKDFGARGTFYVSMGLVNTSNELGEHFRLEHLRAASLDGHEIASHTFNHSSSRRTALSAFRKDVLRGRNELRETTDVCSSSNFAYPYGAVTLSAKRAVGNEMLSCRGTCKGINGPRVTSICFAPMPYTEILSDLRRCSK